MNGPFDAERSSLPCLIRDISERAASGAGVLAALDGRCAAGKSTLARQLQARFGWQVVHMDDFFLRPEQRSPGRYATPGENVDHERFWEEVLLPLRRGEAARFRPFDCHSLAFAEPVEVTPEGVVLVEGSYACHPSLRPHYDLRAFLTVEPQEQLRRLSLRESEEGLRAFRERWIPLEERYFAACGLPQACDYCFAL